MIASVELEAKILGFVKAFPVQLRLLQERLLSLS